MSEEEMVQKSQFLETSAVLAKKYDEVAALREALGAGLLLAQMPGVDMAAWVVMTRKVLENTK